MKSNLLYLLAVLLLFSGCCETEDVEPEQTHLLQRKLSNITFPGGGGITYDLTYTYNDQDQLVRVGGTSIRDIDVTAINYSLEYDSKGRVAKVHNKPIKDLENTQKEWAYTYNDKDQLVKMVRTYVGSGESSNTQLTYLYTYDAANRIAEVEMYKLENTSDVLIGTRFYTYPTPNRVTITSFLANGVQSQKHELVTDDNKLPAYVMPLNSIPIFYFAEVLNEGIITNHNITSLTMLNGVDETLYSGSYQAQYTYNKAGYPLTCTKTFAGGSVEKTEYVYKTK